jgi:hypothetical protein
MKAWISILALATEDSFVSVSLGSSLGENEDVLMSSKQDEDLVANTAVMELEFRV